MRFRIVASGPNPITFLLEPSGREYILQPGDYFEFEWEESDLGPTEAIDHTPEGVTVSCSSRTRMWNSNGDELWVMI